MNKQTFHSPKYTELHLGNMPKVTNISYLTT